MHNRPLQPLILHLVTVLLVLWALQAQAAPGELILLTVNDLHGQLEPFQGGASGSPAAGGLARLASIVKTFKKNHPGKCLAVCSGDSLTGPYFLHFGGRAIFSALSLTGIDVGTPGNHEFDRGPSVLAGALGYCSFPMVVSNMTLPAGSPLAAKLQKSLVFERNGLRIGVFGLMTPDLALISGGGRHVTVTGLEEAAREMVQDLRSRQQADLVIAVTHIGLDMDRQLAARVGGMDVICGGHSHDLLASGEEVVVPRPDGHTTLIVQAGARGEYLGLLRLGVEGGRVISHTWKTIPMDASVADDPDAAACIKSYRDRLPPASVLTISTVTLDWRSASVRTRETAVGNLITDIMRTRFHTDIALCNGGGIRGDRVLPAGAVTTGDIEAMLPLENRITILRLNGSVIRQVLERSVSLLPQQFGGFLQVSGLRFSVDPDAPPRKPLPGTGESPGRMLSPGGRISDVQVCSPGGSCAPLDPGRTYSVAVNSFIAEGGDGYVMLQAAGDRTKTGVSLRSAIVLGLAQMPSIAPATAERIQTLP